jgi:hypothetical protein
MGVCHTSEARATVGGVAEGVERSEPRGYSAQSPVVCDGQGVTDPFLGITELSPQIN